MLNIKYSRWPNSITLYLVQGLSGFAETLYNNKFSLERLKRNSKMCRPKYFEQADFLCCLLSTTSYICTTYFVTSWFISFVKKFP